MHTDDTRLVTAGESSLLLYFGDSPDAQVNARVQAATVAVEAALGAQLVDLVPSYASLLVIYDPAAVFADIARRIRAALANIDGRATASREITLPVYYSPESGADLEDLAARAGLSVDEVIDLHSSASYRVYAIGFAPGFAYLGEVDARIASPRLATPRRAVPAGSVAIADRQTAVYPNASPGGWNLLGLCPTTLFDADTEPHMPVAVGDTVRFEAVSRADFLALGGLLP